MNISIRPSNASDVSRLFDVWETAVAATHDFLSDADQRAIANLVRDEYLPHADLTVAVNDDDVALAFMGMTDNEIDSLFVHAEARGTGVGRKLVQFARDDKPVVRTEVNEQNAQGVAFWKHMGFREVGRAETDRQGRPYPLLLLEWRR
ncbi:MAG: acetyltransferase [Pseudomonadota bacterium]